MTLLLSSPHERPLAPTCLKNLSCSQWGQAKAWHQWQQCHHHSSQNGTWCDEGICLSGKQRGWGESGNSRWVVIICGSKCHGWCDSYVGLRLRPQGRIPSEVDLVPIIQSTITLPSISWGWKSSHCQHWSSKLQRNNLPPPCQWGHLQLDQTIHTRWAINNLIVDINLRCHAIGRCWCLGHGRSHSCFCNNPLSLLDTKRSQI